MKYNKTVARPPKPICLCVVLFPIILRILSSPACSHLLSVSIKKFRAVDNKEVSSFLFFDSILDFNSFEIYIGPFFISVEVHFIAIKKVGKLE